MGDPRDGEADALGREGTGAAAVRDGRPRLRPGTVPGREDELRQAGGGAPGDRGSREGGRRLMPPEAKELVLGGQAVIEGVMMKGPLAYAVAVRKASGEIRVRDFPLVESTARKRIAKIPLVRGVVTMAAMLAIGYRALQYSADEAMEDAEGASAAAKGTGEGGTSGGRAMAGGRRRGAFS